MGEKNETNTKNEDTEKKDTKSSKSEKIPKEDPKNETSDSDSDLEDKIQDVLEPPMTQLDENLQKLITPEERKKMEENLDLVIIYLEDIGIVDMNIDREKLIVTVPFDYEDFTFLSHIVLSPEWILIKTSIFEIETLADVSVFTLFAEVLKGNFILNSVVYALDPENKSIWAQADVPISADFETFKLSYFSIVFAIDYFMKNISSKINLQLKSTLDRDELKKFESSPSNLYI
jgi:hypothetical protein